MFDKTQVKYAVAVARYGWHHSDCAPRRAALKAGRWAGIGLASLAIFGLLSNLILHQWLGLPITG